MVSGVPSLLLIPFKQSPVLPLPPPTGSFLLHKPSVPPLETSVENRFMLTAISTSFPAEVCPAFANLTILRHYSELLHHAQEVERRTSVYRDFAGEISVAESIIARSGGFEEVKTGEARIKMLTNGTTYVDVSHAKIFISRDFDGAYTIGFESASKSREVRRPNGPSWFGCGTTCLEVTPVLVSSGLVTLNSPPLTISQNPSLALVRDVLSGTVRLICGGHVYPVEVAIL